MTRKDELNERTREQLVDMAEKLALADNDLRWALIQARKEAGISQRELAGILGVKQSTISTFESHDNDPKMSTIRRYALAVGADISHQVDVSGKVFHSDGWVQVTNKSIDVSYSTLDHLQQYLLAPTSTVSKRTDFGIAA